MENKITVSFCVNPNIWEKIRQIANNESRTVSSLMTYILNKYLEDEKNG